MKGFIFMINYFRFVKLSIIFIQSLFIFVFNSFFLNGLKGHFLNFFILLNQQSVQKKSN